MHFAGTGRNGLTSPPVLPSSAAPPPQAAAADHALEKAETEDALAAAGRELTALRAQAQAAAGADGAAQLQLVKAAQALQEAEKKVAVGEKTARTLTAQLKASAEADEAAQVTPPLSSALSSALSSSLSSPYLGPCLGPYQKCTFQTASDTVSTIAPPLHDPPHYCTPGGADGVASAAGRQGASPSQGRGGRGVAARRGRRVENAGGGVGGGDESTRRRAGTWIYISVCVCGWVGGWVLSPVTRSRPSLSRVTSGVVG